MMRLISIIALVCGTPSGIKAFSTGDILCVYQCLLIFGVFGWSLVWGR